MKMIRKFPVIISVLGFFMVLGAEGDACCNTGRYIVARAVMGCVMMVVGCIWSFIRRRKYEIDH